MQIKFDAFDNDEFIKKSMNRAGEITRILNDMEPGEAALYSFLFLPFFLVACLGILRLMGYEKGVQKIVVPILVLTYCASLTFMKLEGARRVAISSTADQATYYMVYSCLQNMDIEKVCRGANIPKNEVEQLHLLKSKSFGFVDGRLHIRNPEMIKLIKERMEKLNEVLFAGASVQKNVSVDSIIIAAQEYNFGNLSKKVVEKVVSDHSDKLEYHKSDNGDYLTAVP
jgi:hypothetical protein